MSEEQPGFRITGPMTRTEKEWVDVMLRAFTVMRDRQAKREDVWRRSGARGMVYSLYAKAERVFTNVMSGDPDPDEAVSELLDIINYAIFTHVQVLRYDYNGEWPWPK